MKSKFIQQLRDAYWSVPRGSGSVDELAKYLEANEFFEAPCSTSHHLCKDGGLLEHSLNVAELAVKIAQTLNFEEKGSVVVAALLHDVGKTGQFGKQLYIPNYLKSTNERSTKKPFVTNPDLLYVPHEIRSVQIVSQFLDLTEEESFAILQHNGLYGDLKYSLMNKETPLQMIIHWADMWASRVTEKGNEVNGDL